MNNGQYKYLGILQLFVGIVAIPAGLSLIIDPSGNPIGFSTDLLQNSPFLDYSIPGWFLLGVNGIISIIGAWFTFSRHKWSSFTDIFLGVFLVFWICIQVYFIGLIHFLQPLFFIVGIVEIFLSLSILKDKNLK